MCFKIRQCFIERTSFQITCPVRRKELRLTVYLCAFLHKNKIPVLLQPTWRQRMYLLISLGILNFTFPHTDRTAVLQQT
jgi:hypothetical protein